MAQQLYALELILKSKYWYIDTSVISGNDEQEHSEKQLNYI